MIINSEKDENDVYTCIDVGAGYGRVGGMTREMQFNPISTPIKLLAVVTRVQGEGKEGRGGATWRDRGTETWGIEG